MLACIVLYRFLPHNTLLVTTHLLDKTIYICTPRIYFLESNLLSLTHGLGNCTIGCTLGCVVWSSTVSCLPQLEAHALQRVPSSSSTWLFHHHVCILHGLFEETSHTCFVACKIFSFGEVCDGLLSFVLALNTSESSACFLGSLSLHTFMRGTNLRLGWGGMETLKSSTSNLCCDAHSSPQSDLYVGHRFPETPPILDEVYLVSSKPRLVGDKVFRVRLRPCVPDIKLVSKRKLFGVHCRL